MPAESKFTLTVNPHYEAQRDRNSVSDANAYPTKKGDILYPPDNGWSGEGDSQECPIRCYPGPSSIAHTPPANLLQISFNIPNRAAIYKPATYEQIHLLSLQPLTMTKRKQQNEAEDASKKAKIEATQGQTDPPKVSRSVGFNRSLTNDSTERQRSPPEKRRGQDSHSSQ